jgi:hypothetical protein
MQDSFSRLLIVKGENGMLLSNVEVPQELTEPAFFQKERKDY